MIKMVRTEIDSNLTVWAWSQSEARMLYREVWLEDPYLREGLKIHDGAVVLDIGANIGMWSMGLMRKGKNLTIHAFEPAPPLYVICARNLGERSDGHQVQLHPIALGAKTGQLTLEFHPLATCGSTVDAKAVKAARQNAKLASWARAMAEDAVTLNLLGESGSRMLKRSLQSRWLRPLVLAALLGIVAVLEQVDRHRIQSFVVEVRPLGEWIRALALEKVDLIKIDVEGAEEAVLDGLDDEVLAKVSQLAIEVHQVPGRLERLSHKLKRAGFQVTRRPGQLQTHALLGISTLYAHRP